MRRRGSLVPIFVIFLIIALLLFFLSQKGLLNGMNGVIQTVTVPMQRVLFGASHSLTVVSESSELKRLRDENQQLRQQLVKEKEIEKENTALHDQFQTTTPESTNLLPAHIIAMNGFFPGVSRPEEVIIDQGSNDQIKKGFVVVVKNNLIGTIIAVSSHAAKVALLTQKSTSFTAQTVNSSALGIVKAQDGDVLLFDNVVLSDKLTVGDLVVTKGDIKNGSQIPPGLVVGKIISVSKQTSSLFQTAQVQSLVDVTKLESVFVMKTR